MAQGGYLVSGKDGDHLPTETDGKLDHHLMGAAWAALHGGYRGNKYAGPNKAEAITKLKKLYEREKMGLPGSEETRSAALCAILPKGEPPKSIMVVPAGRVELRDQGDTREPWTNDEPEMVVARTMALMTAGGMTAGLPIDYDHATDLAAPHGAPAPAAGWMKRFFVQAGEVWADVDWTTSGAAAIAEGAWRYFSPVFDFTPKDRRVLLIKRAALTNNPALYGTAIAAARIKEETEMTYEQFRVKLAAIMGIKEEQLTAFCGADGGDGMGGDEFSARMAALFGCDKGASKEDICAAAEKHFKAIKKGDGEKDDDKGDDKAAARLIASGAVVSTKDYNALQKDVRDIQTAQMTARAESKVDALIAAKKLLKSQRNWAIAYCARDAAGFEEFASKQVPIELGETSLFRGAPPKPGDIATATANLSAREIAICSTLATVSIEDYAKQKVQGGLRLETVSAFGKVKVNLGGKAEE